jgi:autotransporter translocation and assembly factor TamB
MEEKIPKLKVKRSVFRKIINVFIGIFLGIVLLVLIFLGFSQTKTFREILRKQVIALVNKETNGKLNIEKIDGTILTSLFLRKSSIIVDNDTLLWAGNIEIKISPLQLILKKIYVRKILLDDVKIQMFQNSDSTWNFQKFFKPKPEDNTKSNFSLQIQVADIQLRNISLTHQTFQNYKSQKVYPMINFNDLRINQLNFSAEAFADIHNSNYLLILKKFSFSPNLTRFTLQNISGEIAVTKQFTSIKNFSFITDSSNFKISARLDSVNLLGGIKLEDFKNYPVTLDLNIRSFNFDDLSSFIGSTEILKGTPSLQLKAHGKFGGFKIDKGILDYKNSHFEISGKVLNLNTPNKLFIQARISNTDINYKDVNNLMPTLKLPEYAKLQLKGINIEYEGEPTNFKTKFTGQIDEGKLTVEGFMNVNTKPITYNIKFETENLNLHPVLDLNTSLNAKGSLSGKGFSPVNAVSDLKLALYNSSINNYSIEKLDLNANAKDRTFNFDLTGTGMNAIASVKGNMTFDEDTIPTYHMTGSLKNVDLSKFVKDKNYKSNLNFRFNAEGRNFDPDEINGSLTLGIDSSSLRDKQIDNAYIKGELVKDSTHREILLSSDFVDFNIKGNFSLKKATELVAYEVKTISGIIKKKIGELNPLTIINHEAKSDTVAAILPSIINNELKFDYDFKLKDFELIAMLMGNDRLDISGSGKGSVSNLGNNFSISTDLKIDYMIMTQNAQTVYLSDINTKFNLTRDNRSFLFDKLFGSASITGKRLYSGSNIKNFSTDLEFNQSKVFFNVAANIEDLIIVDGEGTINISPHEQQLSIDQLSFNYDGIEWTNRDTIKVMFNPDYIKIVRCTLQKDTTTVSLSGVIESSGKQKLNVEASKISGDILSKYLFEIKNNQLTANGTLTGAIEGEFQNPVINSNFSVNNFSFAGSKLGYIKGSFNYIDKQLKTDFSYFDPAVNNGQTLLNFNGAIPVDLTFGSVEKRFIDDGNLWLQLKSDKFNLNALGNLVPAISDQNGILNADISVSGSFNKPVYNGYLTLHNGNFRSTYNNLMYKSGVKLSFGKNEITVDSMVVSNAGDSKYSGTLSCTGNISFDGFRIKDIALRINGDLAIMGQESQSVSPLFYGDLLIGTDGDLILTKRDERIFLKGNLLLKHTDLVYTTGQDYNSVSNKNFNFVFLEDSTKIDKELLRFNKVLAKEKDLQKQELTKIEKQLNFDYEIGISTENNAKLLFILAQAANQKLTVEMQGNLKYESYNGDLRAQGAFQLLPGSKLEFFKTFEAEGTIRFESDITNPFLDITSTYTSDYINPHEENGTPQEVAVKIRIKSPLSELGKSITNNPESLSIYIGARNIQNNVAESRYDYADALSFILIGKFKDDLTAQDKTQVAGQTNVIGNTATSFLGSMLSNYVNSAVGDLVNNISINQTGEYTKFSLSGRLQNLRYSLGGTTEVFQNIGKANVKLEYLFSQSFSIRIERRDPVVSTYSLEDKITEAAFKYKFGF